MTATPPAIGSALLIALWAVVTGVVTATTWAAIVWAHSVYRSWQIEKQIKRWLSIPIYDEWKPENGLLRMGLMFYNGTHVPITIRSVDFIMDEPGLDFRLDAHGPSQTLDDQLKAGDEYGFMEMPPWTPAHWGATSAAGRAFVISWGVPLKSCRIEAQYVTLLKRPKRLRIDVPADEGSGVEAVWEAIFGKLSDTAPTDATPDAAGDSALSDTTRGDTAPDV